MTDLAAFVEEQRALLNLLTKYEARFDAKTSSEKTLGYVTALAQRLEDIFNRFEAQHETIIRTMRDESMDPTHVPYIDEDVYFEFSEKYLTFKGKIFDSHTGNSVMQSPMASTFVAPHSRSDTTIGSDSKLPKISLPKFNGEYMEWIPFRDIYFSLVHQNDALTKIQKFYYLRSTLGGEASNLIKNISATEANYDTAWKILEARYHNKRMLVGSLISKLFGIPKSDGGFQSIRTLLDSAQECISSLQNLCIDTKTWDPVLIHLLVQKLDLQSRRDWEQSLKSSTEIPPISELFSFLERTFRTLESMADEFSYSNTKRVPVVDKNKKLKSSSKNGKASCNVSQISKKTSIVCTFCEKSHNLSKCFRFLALSLNNKINFLNDRNICHNCLMAGHDHNNCKSPFRCMTCKKSHHTMLHPEEFVREMDASGVGVDGPSTGRVTSHAAQTFHSVLLYTIRLNVLTHCGAFSLRALLDPGSQGSLISESAVQLMGLRRFRSHCKVVGVGQGSENLSRFSVELDLYTRKQQLVLSCTALVLPNLSSYTPDPASRNISLPNVEIESLADPFFYKSDSIDLILGSDICSKIKIPTESFIYNDLFFQNTHFGWVFSGPNNTETSNKINIHNVNLESILKSFWEQEEIPLRRKLSNEELACEDHFRATTTRNRDGRYMVSLPFRSVLSDGSSPRIHNNVFNAFRRLGQLEMSFVRKPLYCESYRNFMLEYEVLGHMTKVGVYPKDVRRNSYFLPHHGVLKENSSTTKLRVVFDGSSHTGDNKSLNSELSPGPALQNDLPGIMTKWRRHRIAVCSDIEKMFRQINVYQEHRKFQQILWRFNPHEEIGIYELNTVTYGTAPAPFLAIRVLRQLAKDFEQTYTKAAKILIEDSYVDDIISGADCFDDALSLYKDLCTLLRNGGFNLRKWITNSKELLEQIPESDRETSATLNFDRDNVVKTLVNLDQNPLVSKRMILSESARLYDPLGWLTPTTVIAKSLFKQLWEYGIDWDEEIPLEIRNSKSKVSPIKTVSIPRLELCAASLCVQLSQKVKESLKDLKIGSIVYWSDSSTVLSWIRKSPSNWTVYVANRVADIQRLSNPVQWRYVPSQLNPADCASRGILAEELVEQHSWWFGPKFLYESESSWPENLTNLCTSEEEKVRKASTNSAIRKTYPDIFCRFSKLQTLLRVVSLCFRFVHNCRNPDKRLTDPLSLSEINMTLNILVKVTQRLDFSNEIASISAGKSINRSPILKLLPFLDENGLLRVGGRLQNSNFAYDIKHPLILSKCNPLSYLIIVDAHERTLHGGVTLTMSFVNRRFWIVSGNQLAKGVVHRCIKCYKYIAKTSQQVMGNLPAVRLNMTRPFRHSGVDYAGPILIKNSNLRSSTVSKGYICLFICMVTKAIHLEAVTDMTTTAFLAAFKRFISRRGTCTDIYSDCGTNFVGASKELRILHNKNLKSLSEELRHYLSLTNTTWHFIPPASPNFGGLWEAGVKSVKHHLKRVTNDRNLTFEELATLLCQIESCLNSRPLCPLSSDPSNFEALTPAHFLVGEPTTCLPEQSLLDTNMNILTRWKIVEKLKQHFWMRWHHEYLNRLQALPKWLKTTVDPKVGDLVLVADDRCGPGQWILGRIVNTHPGPDGKTRVVSVLVKNKTIKRPISKISLLPDNTPPSESS
ncbi:uncharacterized protein LOC142235724 [Haematobia irritans]|uniref:uncharacterized protein LOC142235724 n=1 Tax=Haematobia irritans TaxID=7368 RepID=UPI003F501102